MDRALADRKRRFLDGLGTGRVSMAGARQILGGIVMKDICNLTRFSNDLPKHKPWWRA